MSTSTPAPAPNATSDEVEIFEPPPGAPKNWLPAKRDPDEKRLAELENTISRGKQTFLEVGLALKEIRDSRLYRKKFSSFDAYCRKRWNFQKSQAYKLIRGAETHGKVCPRGHSSDDLSPRVVHALQRIADQDARDDILADAQRPDGSVNVRQVEAAVIQHLDPIRTPPDDVLDELRHLEKLLFGLMSRVSDPRFVADWLEKLSRRVAALKR